MIRCSDETCPSRTGEETPFFNINVIIDEEREYCEHPTEIPAHQFECQYCGSPGEESVSRPTMEDMNVSQR